MSVRNMLRTTSLITFSLISIASAHAAVPASGELNFTVMREGDEIGTHRLAFKESEDGLKVDIKTDIAVKVMGTAFYRFEHDGHEVWKNNRLYSLHSKTNDDGTNHQLDAATQGDVLIVDGDGRKGPEVPDIIPASLWNQALISQTALLNTLDGSHMQVSVSEIGREIVEVKGNEVSATHYSLTGALNRELWYDAADVLVQVQFAGGDGSEITYVLK